MSFSVEDTISKCIAGNATRDILKSIEEDIVDPRALQDSLMKDLNRVGFNVKRSDIQVENTCVKVSIDAGMLESRTGEVMSIADTYSRTYPEFEVLVSDK